MSKLDDLTIDMMEKNMQYIKHGIANNKSDLMNAQWLYNLIKSYNAHVDGQCRAEATAERNRLNGGGYSGKAAH